MLVLGLDMSSRTKLKVLGLGLDIEVLDFGLECSILSPRPWHVPEDKIKSTWPRPRYRSP